jgi:hypothetical membrane protein
MRIGGFTDRFPLVGPLVFISSILYFAAQIACAWVWQPPYSVVDNTISDLGNTASPRHALMNAAFVFLGVVMAAGSLLVSQEFRESSPVEKRGASVGFATMGVAGVGTVIVGLFPENVSHDAHLAGAVLAIGGGAAAIFILGWFVGLPERLRFFTRLWAPVAAVAAVLFACHRDFGIGAGSMERVAAYPVTIWLISFGVYIARRHATGPGLSRFLLGLEGEGDSEG